MDWHAAQELGFQILVGLTIVMPLLEKIANSTKNKVDNKVVDFLKLVLAYVPRVRLGGTK